MLSCKIYDICYAIESLSIRRSRVSLFVFRLFIILIMGVSESTASTPDTISVATIYFKQGKFHIEKSFQNNAASLSRIDSILRTESASRIVIVGSSSPEGPQELNMRLGSRRATAIANYIKKHMPQLDSVQMTTVGENWSLLRKLILEDPAIQHRKEILRIIDSNRNNGDKQALLTALAERRVMRNLLSTTYPKLRQTTLYVYKFPPISTQDTLAVVKPVVDMVEQTPMKIDNPSEVSITEMGEDLSRYDCNQGLNKRFAIKTNTLYWLALTPNIEVEFFVAPSWSVSGELQYGWWADSNRHRYWRIASGGAETRYWLSPEKGYFNGHFVGAYILGGIYEFMFRPQLGIQGEVYLSGGLTYGYTVPLGCSFAMEFSIGVGYLNTLYREYHWSGNCYKYDQSRRLNYFGPTKAKVSLMWRIGKGGGRR